MSSSDHERVIGHLPASPALQAPRDVQQTRRVLSGRPERTGPLRPILSGRPATSSRAGVAGGTAGLDAMGQALATPEVALNLQAIRRAAEERGYEAGYTRGRQELDDALEAAASFAAQLESAAPREITTVAHVITEVALAVARRILGAEASLDPSVLVSAIEDAVALVNGSPTVRIYLNPGAVDAVRDAWEERHGRAHLGKDWVFEADPTLPPGGCVLRHEHGFVDAGLEAQIEEIGIALDRAIPTLLRLDGAGDGE
jgi:flagellar biosynthesis/type III secretory pathway protein FliH